MPSILMLNVLEGFKKIFPDNYAEINKIYSCGKDCLKLHMKNGAIFIFRYAGEDDYSLETFKSYERRQNERAI